MLALELYWDRQRNRYLAGLNSEGEASLSDFPQGDTFRLRIHNAVRNADTRGTLYSDQPWSFTSIRASLIQTIDGKPDTGKFKLGVGDQQTAELTWPGTFANAAAIEAWKDTVKAALIALSNVDADAIVRSDPPDTPSNFLYFTWTDPADDREITVISNSLAPVCTPETKVQRGAPGYQQIIKLVTAPLVMVTDFAFPGADQPTVASKRAGLAGQNAVQRLTLPATVGSLELKYLGAPTSFIATPGTSAEQIAAALNAIVPNGATNASFAVTTVSTGVFDIEFIGPLAAAAQDELDAHIYPSVPPTVAEGDMPLTSPRFERALNGQSSVKLIFELVIVDTGGESKILREVTFKNAATDPSTETALEEQEAVLIKERIVYVNADAGEPTAVVAPGYAVTVPEAIEVGTTMNVAHGRNTLNPGIRLQYKSQIDPEQWREMQLGGEFNWHSTDLNHVAIKFEMELTDDVDGEWYFGRVKVFVSSPDAVLEIFGNLKMLWTQILESLPDGMSVAAKFAALDAAIGLLDGELMIDAAQIDGLLGADQIDLDALAEALKTNAKFVETLTALASNSTFIDAIAEALDSSDKFTTTLIDQFNTKTDLQEAATTVIMNSANFTTNLRSEIVSILQGTAGALNNMVLLQFPTLNQSYPALISGAFAPVPAAAFTPTLLGTTTDFYIIDRAEENAGNYWTVGSGGVGIAPVLNLFPAGSKVYSDGHAWHQATVNGTKYSAADFDRELFSREVNEDMLSENTRFGFSYNFTLQALGNCKCFYQLKVERGHARTQADALPAEGTEADLKDIVVDEVLIDLPLVLSAGAVTHLFGYTCTRTADVEAVPVLAATKQVYTRPGIAAAAPAKPRFILRARLTAFDVENVPNPRAQILLTTPANQFATVMKLPA